MVRRLGVAPWLWTVDPQDWRPGATRDQVIAVAGRAGSGDVILLHDWVEQPWAPEALDRSATIGALPAIVRSARERGLTFVTLPSWAIEP
jgi:peptidoglycan/xylan/chitin deacetylase (PgdA/CDA1 family)